MVSLGNDLLIPSEKTLVDMGGFNLGPVYVCSPITQLIAFLLTTAKDKMGLKIQLSIDTGVTVLLQMNES